ncbi:hypothetical protein G7046_g8086 [Stylonectria norvegica]|nr:hypothetical protein G7046_g8086 [Stylonectria norvegica]
MHKYKGQCRLVLRPASTDEVSKILRYCNEKLLAVVPQGGNTGLVGGSIPVFDEIVISMSRMNQIRSFDEVSGSLVVDAGCILEAVDGYLAQKGYIFPLDLGAKGSCHVGGNVATNAGGLRLLRYGSLHGSVLGIEAVLPDGTIMNDLVTLRKNNTGYDLKQLFIGAEGTIGIITKLAFQCPQRSPAVNVALFGLESYEKAQLAFREAKKQLSEILSAFELMDGKSQQIVSQVKGQEKPLEGDHPFYCLIETSGSNGEHDYAKLEAFLEDVMTSEVIADGVVAQDETQLRALWGWREGITECLGHWGGTYKYDVSIPLKEMYQLVEDVKARMEDAGLLGDTDEHPVVAVLGYGHMGDSNLHLNIPVRRYDKSVEKVLEPYVYEWIQKRNGSISAEHGLGIAKKNYIGYSRDETMINLMKQIKNLYDPCTNERPFCQKCIASGRECEGYGREMVFITGTVETKGRVASHPKKGSSSRKQQTAVEEEDDVAFGLTPLNPLTAAWDDHTVVSSQGVEYSVLITALHTNLQSVFRDEAAEEESAGFRIAFPSYVPLELQPSLGEEYLSAASQCLARLPGIDEVDDSAESYCVFLFDHNLAVVPRGSKPDQMGLVMNLGPAHFRSFPNHHYFIRVYRPLATSLALLSRRQTSLSTLDWMTVPWEQHPKSLLDQLLDIVLHLPCIIVGTDELMPLEATLNRRYKAQDFLQNCLSLERQFDNWLKVADRGTGEQSAAYWAEELTSPGGFIPFSNSYTFQDGHTGLAFLYYWMSQILFHQCIESLHRAIFQPVIDAYPNMWPDLPPELQVDVTRYQHGRELAADICRGLDSVLDSTVQPDMLMAPMKVALDLYRDISRSSQDGVLEMIWLDKFRSRLVEKGQHIADVLQKQKWVEVARF